MRFLENHDETFTHPNEHVRDVEHAQTQGMMAFIWCKIKRGCLSKGANIFITN
jgi:hypothetical protein